MVVRVVVKSAWLVVASYVVLREGCFSRSERTKDVVGLRGRREGRKKGGWEEEKMRGKAGEVAAESESGMQ